MAIETPGEAERPPDRRPALALFSGGLLSGAAIVVLALTLSGVIAPATGNAASSVPPQQSGGAAASLPTGVGEALVTLPPIVAPTTVTPTALASGHSIGSADAKVTVEVWADYQCPYCARFSLQVEPQILSSYVTPGKARLVFRDLAFLGEESRWASVAARLAEQQGKFWPYHDYLFANQQGENAGGFTIARLQEIASRIGLDRTTFDAGLQLAAARTLFSQIRTEFEADAARLGIHSTPTVVVNGTPLSANDWASVRTAIDAALAG
jgi:protein-disulfide isomerase